MSPPREVAVLEAQVIKWRRGMKIEVSFRLDTGGSLGVFGPSGAGKSTLLECLAGTEQPDDGCIRFDELSLFPPPLALHLRPVGYLTQEPNLFPHLSVKENVCFAIQNHLKKDSARNHWVAMLKDSLELASIWEASATRISGGQARRVSLARMLARRPRLVLLDEPFTGLDRQTVRELIETLLAWKAKLGFTMIAVDHQAEVLERLCSRVLVLDQGIVVQEGGWEELYERPANAVSC